MRRKLFSIDKTQNFSIKILGKRLFTYTHHYIMRFSLDKLAYRQPAFPLRYEKASLENVDDCSKAPYSLNRMKRYLTEFPEKVDGYIFYREDDTPVGCVWVMYRGGNEFQYRVRKIDALGFHFCVYDEFKGQGLIGYMIFCLMTELRKKEIDSLYCGVRTNNASAIKSYRKLGADIVSEKRFFRIAGLRIPYPAL